MRFFRKWTKADAEGFGGDLTVKRKGHGLSIVCGVGSLHVNGGLRVDEGKVLDRNLPALGETGHDLDGISPDRRDACYDVEALHGLRQLDKVAEITLTAEDPLPGVDGHALGNEIGLGKAGSIADAAKRLHQLYT